MTNAASTSRGQRPARVALFSSCMTDFAAPGPALAALEVLEAMGFDVAVPSAQTCCGQPALNSGYPDAARSVVQHLIDTFAGYDAVVTPAGSCAAMLVHHGPALTGVRGEDEAAIGKLWEFTQFVTTFGADLDLRLNADVVYHESCHMSRVLGERTTPRLLLSRIKGLRIVEMVDADTCCGFGGTFAAKFPELSVAMADVKLGHVRDTTTRLLVSSDPGCLLHLQSRALAVRSDVQSVHIAELTRDALVRDRVGVR